MNVDPQVYLDLVEKAQKLCFFDIEATGLAGDYNSVLVVSIKPFGSTRIITHAVDQPGRDSKVVRRAIQDLAEFDCWVSYYGKGFDVPMLQARALKHRQKPLVKKHHLDLFFLLSSHVKTSRRSQAHFLRWLKVPEKKMDMDPEEWNNVLANPGKALKTMKQRCESDVNGLNALYTRVRHLAREIKP